MIDKVRLAVVGVGDVAHRDYLPEFHRLADRAEIVAVGGAGDERARTVGESLEVPWFTDLDRLLSTVDVDAIVNLTPIQAHLEVSQHSLAAGKHLYTEKPMAPTLADAARLRDTAREAGVVMVAAPCALLFPQVQAVRGLLDEGAIGEPSAARGVMLAGVPPWPGYSSNPAQYFGAGGGPLADMGIYAISVITGLFGRAVHVTALSTRVGDGFVVEKGTHAGARIDLEVDDQWWVILELESGLTATVEANFTAAASQAPALEIMGAGGSIAFDPLDVSTPVRVVEGDDVREIPIHDAGRTAGPDHILGVEDLVVAVTTGREPALSLDHALHCIAVLEASAQSAGERKTVSLDVPSTVRSPHA